MTCFSFQKINFGKILKCVHRNLWNIYTISSRWRSVALKKIIILEEVLSVMVSIWYSNTTHTVPDCWPSLCIPNTNMNAHTHSCTHRQWSPHLRRLRICFKNTLAILCKRWWVRVKIFYLIYITCIAYSSLLRAKEMFSCYLFSFYLWFGEGHWLRSPLSKRRLTVALQLYCSVNSPDKMCQESMC